MAGAIWLPKQGLRTLPRRLANRSQRGQDASFFPAATSHQFTGILPRRPFQQVLRILGVFVIRPGRLDDQSAASSHCDSANATGAWPGVGSDGQFAVSYRARDLVVEVDPQNE